MNKLQKMLKSSSKEIRGIRADLLAGNIKREQSRLVMDLEDSLASMTTKLDSLNDLYPNSEMTLRIVSKDFDAKAWVRDTQKLKVDIKMKEVELDIARETTSEWFDELPSTTGDLRDTIPVTKSARKPSPRKPKA